MSLMMSKTPGISAFPEGDNMMCWTASIQGIEATPYEGQTYKLNIKFPVIFYNFKT
jgi:ubiquitin-conjugating enzyme E2 C